MTAYDWFIVLAAIPATALGFLAVMFILSYVAYNIWKDW